MEPKQENETVLDQDQQEEEMTALDHTKKYKSAMMEIVPLMARGLIGVTLGVVA